MKKEMSGGFTPLQVISWLPLRLFLSILVFQTMATTSIIHAEKEESPPLQSRSDLNRTLEEISRNIRKVELPNGIRLILMKRSYAPIAALYVKFLAGGSDETEATQGIAHMLEHMLFKGTPSMGTRDYEKEKKYDEVILAWARRMDARRTEAMEARKKGDVKKAEALEKRASMWKKRILTMSKSARAYIIPDEDSYLYSLNGERGYNAYTSRDLTNYQIELPANRLEVWARIESDRFKNSVLRDFYTERDVVAEERRKRVDNVPRAALMEKFFLEVYGSHPYAKPLIGSMNSILFLNYDQANDFYHTFYAPNNMTIAIVGDIDFDRTEALVRKYFGDMKVQKIPRNHPAPPRARPVHVELKKESSPFQVMAWFKPNMPHPDDLTLEVLSRILAGGQDSRLFQRLVIRDRLATQINVSSSYPGERYENLFFLTAVPAPGRTYDEVEKGIHEEIVSIVKNGVTQDELDRVKVGLSSEMIYSMRSNADLADRLTYYETITGDYKIMFDVYRQLDQITVGDIQRVAAQYLKPEIAMTARLMPPDEIKK